VNQETVTTGAASAGTPHTHQVTPKGHEAYILGSNAPDLTISLYHKGAGAIALYTDDIGAIYTLRITGPPTSSNRRYHLHTQWNINLDEDDKVALKFTASALTNHEWVCIDDHAIRLRFEWISEQQNWATFP
jgi:hypothetical protein